MSHLPGSPALSAAEFQDAIARHARYSLGKAALEISARDLFQAIALAVRDRLVDGMLETENRYERLDSKRLYYLSIEFLIGRSLRNNLSNLGILDVCHEALRHYRVDLDAIEDAEPDAALGNGGLGRLAACFLDSLATLGLPGYGYGINYEYGLFKQEIDNGYQKERPDNWLAEGTPWQIRQPEEACVVPVYGRIEHATDRHGHYNPMWMDWKVLIGVPHDMPIVGYGGRTVNFLRLYSARASREFDMQIFNDGDYFKAVEQKMTSETISKVLYPSDSVASGQELRLLQEYFLVACAIRDVIRRYRRRHDKFDQLPSKAAIQLNDTHPALAVAELMRILVDENDLPWEEAWEVTRATFGYTNHTLLPEALERWPVALLDYVLPRHLQIIYEINRRFLDEVAARYPCDPGRLRRMSLIEEDTRKQVRMAHLAIVGSHSVNGVSALHTELIQSSLVPDFAQLWPERFNNKTNGVTPRRWLLGANPQLSELISAVIGRGWVSRLEQLRALEPYSEDGGFCEEFLRIKRANKERLARVIREITRVSVDPDSLFDVHAKRIHAYKRQLLNVMHIIDDYLCIHEGARTPGAPRTYVFAGKAAPGYWVAKQIIKLVNSVAGIINSDRKAREWMRVVFIPDYRVSLAELIIPAADLSEQISTAGKEASGTGNIKFAMNGALTIGTLDGANIEIRQEVGAENIFIFGLTAQQVQGLTAEGGYRPREHYDRDPAARRVLDALASDLFCPREPGLFQWIRDALLDPADEHVHLADLPSYLQSHACAGAEYIRTRTWSRKAILNVARIHNFSSDRTIAEYAGNIWHLEPATGG
jgi:glycogen phosphorylase